MLAADTARHVGLHLLRAGVLPRGGVGAAADLDLSS